VRIPVPQPRTIGPPSARAESVRALALGAVGFFGTVGLAELAEAWGWPESAFYVAAALWLLLLLAVALPLVHPPVAASEEEARVRAEAKERRAREQMEAAAAELALMSAVARRLQARAETNSEAAELYSRFLTFMKAAGEGPGLVRAALRRAQAGIPADTLAEDLARAEVTQDSASMPERLREVAGAAEELAAALDELERTER
jgi:hypothetical protein